MALGGGTFLVQNKVLPGAYINFVSAANASATLSGRGVAAVALSLGWKFSDDVIEITAGDLMKNSAKLFGCSYSDDSLIPLRELFLNATSVLVYPLDGDGAVNASCSLGTARRAGSKGNSISVCVAKAEGDEGAFDVITLLGGAKVDSQTVSDPGQLTDNDLVVFNKSAELSEAAAIPLTGGVDGENGADAHAAFLAKLESRSFNAVCCLSPDKDVKRLYASFTKRMREDVGKKFQCVLYNYAADYEGVVNVKNPCLDGNEALLAAWVGGLCAGLAVNRSALNRRYDGELSLFADYTQSELEDAIGAGEFVIHRVGSELRVLMDINSLVTLSEERGELFRENRTIRVVDQIGNDIALIFAAKYLGSVSNDAAGRVSLWSDIVQHHKQLRDIRAIEDFSEDDVMVERGNAKDSVVVRDAVTVVNSMAKLYMTVTVG